ncbi:4-hydroxybenzoate polyprenyltransferase, mitochondrial [Cytospora mali]|uniref:Diterpenoid pyrone biosynthesis cluster protein C n=1 Tax=Cytospora mali TaxID=578113 RepID=A0A194V7B5_CYTMA|nr:4-hydroxybenzoate polyprenyltransferase, mitochondrial [Valsa mali var. pyri (nom. inval.)]
MAFRLNTFHQVGKTSLARCPCPVPGRRIQFQRLAVHTGLLSQRSPAGTPAWKSKNQERLQSTLPYTEHSLPSTWTPPTKGILSKLPPSWVPFAELSRIEKPGGLYGFYMAYLIGLGYGACLVPAAIPPSTIAQTAAVLLVYNVFLRGAACTVNDILDREYDRQVARCKNRPVARGAVTPAQGYVWYAAQTVGAAASIACLPNPTLALAYAVPIQLVVSLYPLGKRFTDFPQLILSAPIAGGLLMASASVGLDPFDMSSLAITGATASLTLSHYIWTTIFDYVNACQDTRDDIEAGVRSMAVRYHDTKAFITTLGAAQVGCLVLTGVLGGFSPIYFIGAAGGNALWLTSMAMTVKRSRPDVCAWWFAWGGLLVSGTTAAALFAEYYYKRLHNEPEGSLE